MTEDQTLTVQQAIDLAVQHQNAGELPKAESIYQQILSAGSNHPVALHLQGVLSHQIGKRNISVDLITKALAINPIYAQAQYNLGSILQEVGQLNEAIISYTKAITNNPNLAEAHQNLGKLLKEQSKRDEAVTCFRKVLGIEPGDEHHGARLYIAGLGIEKLPERTPENYMKNFYSYKPTKWGHNNSHYRGHQLVKEAVKCVMGEKEKTSILDLGCGTGSLANFLHTYVSRLDGVDLSPDMLKRSRKVGLYDTLTEKDLIQHLKETSNSCGLVVAAAVLIHFSDLEFFF